MEPSDGELLERWRTGDALSGEALFERYYDMVERFFLNKVSGGGKDLVQETYLRPVGPRLFHAFGLPLILADAGSTELMSAPHPS